MGSNYRHNRIDRLLIGTAHVPRFDGVVMLAATTLLWCHNQIYFIVLFYYTILNKIVKINEYLKMKKARDIR